MQFDHKIFFFSTLLILNGSFINAQKHKDDSLRAVIKTATNDTNYINALNELSWNLGNTGVNKEADSLARISLALSQKLNYAKGIFKAYSDLGNVCWALANYPEAMNDFLKSLEIANQLGNKHFIANAYSHMGSIFKLEGNYPEALKNDLKALKIFDEEKDEVGCSKMYNNLGNIYAEEKNEPEAIKYYRRSRVICLKHNDKYGIAGTALNIASSFMMGKKYDSAMIAFNEALHLAEEMDDKFDEAMILGNLGAAYEGLKDPENALKYSFKSLDRHKEIGDKRGLSDAYTSIAEIYQNKKNYGLAKKYYDSSLVVAKAVGSTTLLETIYKSRSQLASETNDPRSALEDFKNYIVYRDSQNNELNTKKMVKEQMQYDFGKKQAADSIRNSEQAKQEELKHDQEIKQQKIYTYGGAIGFLLMLLVAGISFRAFKQKQKANEIISEQKNIVEDKQKEILDSIHYAKRIQRSLLPTEKYIDKNFKRLKN